MLVGLFSFESRFLQTRLQILLIFRQRVRSGSDRSKNNICMRAFESLLIQYCPAIARPPLLRQGLAYLAKNRRSILWFKNVRKAQRDTVREKTVVPNLVS